MPLQFKETLARIFRPPAPRERAGTPLERRLASRRPAYQTVLVEWEDLEKGAQAYAGRLENRSAKGLGIRGPRLIPPGKTILVSAEEGPAIKAVVRHCASGPGGFYLGTEIIPREQRRSDREPMYCAAKISCTREGRRDDLSVVIRNASETGLQLESPEPLSAEELIEISHLGSYRQGTVTHCQRDKECYQIGVQFIGPARHEGNREIN